MAASDSIVVGGEEVEMLTGLPVVVISKDRGKPRGVLQKKLESVL